MSKQFNSLIENAIQAIRKPVAKEGAMSELDIMMDESSTFKEFMSKVKSDPKFKDIDLMQPAIYDFLRDMWDASGRPLNEKAVSQAQQKFMGMVHAYKKGEMDDAPASIKKAAKGMTKKAAKDFASTKHKGLPTRVDEATVPKQELIAKMPSHVKGWAKYVAQHKDGSWWYYADAPRIVPNVGWKSPNSDGNQFSSDIKTDPAGWETSSQELNENMLKEYTDKDFSGGTLINQVNTKKPDAEGAKFIEEFFPNGFKSQPYAVKALRDHDQSPIKQRMGQYAPMFVHVQFHEFTDQAGEKYGVHQTQYYNSNFNDQDPKFNPRVTKLYIYKRKDPNNPSPQAQKDQEIGTILVKTEEYVKDLEMLRRGGQLGQRVSESKQRTTKTEAIRPEYKAFYDQVYKHVNELDTILGQNKPPKVPSEMWNDLYGLVGQMADKIDFLSDTLSENKMTTTESIIKRLKEDSDYQAFFKSAMDKFGVKSPKELSDKKKKEFFNYVDKNYKAKGESLNEEFFAAHTSDNTETRKSITQLNNTFKALQDQYKVPTRVLDIAVDLINQLVEQGYEDGRAEVEGLL